VPRMWRRPLNTYDVSMRSKPGMYEQYNGIVTVQAENDEQAIEAALLKLKNGVFPDRNREMWKVESVTRRM